MRLPEVVATPAAQTPPAATEGEQRALKSSEEDEACTMFTAMANVVLTGGWSAQRVSRPVELDVGHARELAAKAQTTACPRMRPHER